MSEKSNVKSAERGTRTLQPLVGSEMVQVLEITPADSWHYDSLCVEATNSFAQAVHVVECVMDRQIDEIEEDPESGWEGREITIKFKLMRRDDFEALKED